MFDIMGSDKSTKMKICEPLILIEFKIIYNNYLRDS